MINIHSFLHGKLKRYSKSTKGTAFTLAIIILVLSTNSSYGVGSLLNINIVKAQVIGDAFHGVEETAGVEMIQLNQNAIQVSDNFIGIVEKSKRIQEEQIAKLARIEELVENQTIRLEQIQEEKAIQEAIEAQEQAKEKAMQDAIEAEEKAEEKAEAEKNTNVIKLTSENRAVLERIVEAEAGGEDIKGKMLVANVIINRVNSRQFPGSVKNVVFQQSGSTYQFSPIKDGRYWSVKISKDSKNAVGQVLAGKDESKGALYFSARGRANKNSMSWFDRNLTWLFQYGGHEFYK
jgi:N-acetylmuramoyl-L-alanine amidase